MCALTTWMVLAYCTLFTAVDAFNSEEHECATDHASRVRRHEHELYPKRPPSGNKYGYALQFETGQVIQYSKRGIASKKFSVDFWMRVEGGQQNPSVILHAYEKCAAEKEKPRGWYIGLHEAGVTRDLRITFTVHSASVDVNRTIVSHSKIEPKRWYHVAATYDGIRMKLYVNQAKVAVGYGQKGLIFDTPDCVVLDVGGDVKRGLFYRGVIDKIRLWNEAISHKTITQSLPENSINSVDEKISMYENFNNRDIKTVKWLPVSYQYPRLVPSTVPNEKHDLSIRKPPCGKTICDNPEVVRSYLKHPESRGMKQLRIRFINIMDDDGARAILTNSEIKSQFKLMQTAFLRYNISWELKVVEIRNTNLRSRTILHGHACQDNSNDGMCIDDYKKHIGITNRDALNVYIVNLGDDKTQGMAVFPWEKALHTEFGGVFLPAKNFATTTVLVKILLWYMMHGV